MQATLKQAAQWYLEVTNFDIPAAQNDLRECLYQRSLAMASGSLPRIYKTFAAVEIVKAALCLLLNQEYPTSFSHFELRHIHALTGLPMPKFLQPRHQSGRINYRGEIICNP